MEPERHIEKLLQAVAKKRREQAGEPFELHPVARQELLREASRPEAMKSGGGFFAQMFSGFGPRLAVALSALVIVGIGIWLARPLFREKPTAATLAMADFKKDRQAAKSEPMPGPAPLSDTAPPTVAAAEPMSNARAEAAAPAAQRSSVEATEKDKAKNENQPVTVVNSMVSNDDEANRKTPPAAESPKQSGAAQPSVARRDLSKSTVAAAQPPAPPASFQNTRAANSFVAGNTSDKVSTSTAPLVATNEIVSSMAFAATDREAKKESNLAGTSGSVNTSQLANFDGTANNQIAAKLSPATQNFYRVVAVPTVRQRGFGGGSAAASLLASFKVEQNGQEIRVVDGDGSVYTGSWQVAPVQMASPAAGRAGGFHFSGLIPAESNVRNARPVPVAPTENNIQNNFQAAQNYSFNVTGTNRNLKQKITFSGNFIPLSNVFNNSNNAGAVGGLAGGRNAMPLNPTPPVMLNSRIAGKAIIGDGREIEVNANPAP